MVKSMLANAPGISSLPLVLHLKYQMYTNLTMRKNSARSNGSERPVALIGEHLNRRGYQLNVMAGNHLVKLFLKNLVEIITKKIIFIYKDLLCKFIY